jgi:hypothetical protein
MVFEHIEELKRSFTDKYVVVDPSRPELRRFDGLTGTVRTVNMNGKALVEFDGYSNIGWYDIDVDFLRIIDAPLPKAVKEERKGSKEGAATEGAAKAKPAAKPVAKSGEAKPAAATAASKMSPAEVLAAARASKAGGAAATGSPVPAAKPAAATPSAARSLSVAEMLAAARAEKSQGSTAPAAPKADKPVADRPQAAPAKARTESAPPTAESAKPDRGKMSVAEMLAYARAEKNRTDEPAAAAAPPVTKSTAPAAEEVAEVEETVVQPASEVSAESDARAETASSGQLSKRDECKTVAQQVAYCRKVDGAR